MSLSLIVSQSADEASAGMLSAVSQGVGYAFAGAGSLLVGVLHDVTGDWTAGLLYMIASAAVLSVVVALVIRCPLVDLRADSGLRA